MLPKVTDEVFGLLQKQFGRLDVNEFIKFISIKLQTENPLIEQYAREREKDWGKRNATAVSGQNMLGRNMLCELYLMYSILDTAMKIAKTPNKGTIRDTSYIDPPAVSGEDSARAIKSANDFIAKLRKKK